VLESVIDVIDHDPSADDRLPLDFRHCIARLARSLGCGIDNMSDHCLGPVLEHWILVEGTSPSTDDLVADADRGEDVIEELVDRASHAITPRWRR
jgi:hypothetical protein